MAIGFETKGSTTSKYRGSKQPDKIIIKSGVVNTEPTLKTIEIQLDKSKPSSTIQRMMDEDLEVLVKDLQASNKLLTSQNNILKSKLK